MPRSFMCGFNLYLKGLLYDGQAVSSGVAGLMKPAGGLFMCDQQLEQSSPTAVLHANPTGRTCSSGSSSVHEERGFFNAWANPVFEPCLFATHV